MRENKEVQDRILNIIRRAEPYDVISIGELARKCGVLRITAQRHLYKLIALNEEFKRLAVYKIMEDVNREYIVRKAYFKEVEK